MSIENLDIIDFISNDVSGNVVLTISDHLVWDEENEHIFLLQQKFNAYLEFIESDQIDKSVYNIEEKSIVIRLYCKYSPNKEGAWFLDRVEKILNNSGYKFQLKQLNEA